MNSRTHQNVLRRVRREAEKRGYLLKPFKKFADDAISVEYLAKDKHHDGYVTVSTTYSKDICTVGDHGMLFHDENGYVFTALFMNQKRK